MGWKNVELKPTDIQEPLVYLLQNGHFASGFYDNKKGFLLYDIKASTETKQVYCKVPKHITIQYWDFASNYYTDGD